MLPLLLATAFAAPPSLPDAPLVAVHVQGHRTIEPEVVLAAVSVGRGDMLTTEAAARALSSVYATGWFSDVQLHHEVGPRGPILVVRVRERPTVRSMEIEGASRVDEEDLVPLVDIAPWTVLRTEALGAVEQRVRDHYVAEGYYLASVTAQAVEVTEDLVDVRVRIEEGKKVRVSSVHFEHDGVLPESRLRAAMATKEGGAIAWLTGRGTFDPSQLELDQQRLQALYWEWGYLDVKVAEPEAKLSVDRESITLRIEIDEGVPYDMGELSVLGDLDGQRGLDVPTLVGLASGDALLDVEEAQWREAVGRGPARPGPEQAGWERGQRFALSTLQHAMARVQQLASDRGYALATVDPQLVRHPDDRRVDVGLVVALGELQRIRHIEFHGNDPTFDHVLRREIGVNEGEPWHGGLVEAGRQALLRYDWFERVEVEPRSTGRDGEVDLHVTVVEKPVQTANAGLSVSPLGGLGGTGSYDSRNIFGTGLSGGASVQYGRQTKSGRLSLYDPAVLDSPWSAGVSVHATDQQLGLAERHRGASISVGRALDPKRDVRLSLQLSSQHRRVLGLDPYQQRLLGGELFRDGLTNEISTSLTIDKRNRRMHATSGWYLSTGIGLAGGMRIGPERVLSLLGGDLNYAQGTANLRLYQPVLGRGDDRLVLRFNSEVAVRHSTDGRVLPWVSRFREGGIDSVRGYGALTLGPRLRTLGSEDPVHADEALNIGGTARWVNNLELEANVLPKMGIAVIGFVDAGNAFGDPWGKGGLDPLGLEWSAGVGARWKTSPLGPIRVDVGVPLGTGEAVKPAVQVGFGVSF